MILATNYDSQQTLLTVDQFLLRSGDGDRIPDQKTLKNEIAAWEKQRIEQSRTIDWQFTNDDARTTLKRLYPSITA